MSPSLLYHTNQIQDVQVLNHEYHPDKVLYKAVLRPKQTSCPCCVGEESISKGLKIRKLRMAPLGDKMAVLMLQLHRLQCANCLHIWWPSIPFAGPKKRYTISFEKFVIRLMNFATIESVANLLGVSWSLIKDIHKEYLRREYQKPDLGSLKYIGIDEFSIRKGRQYMTIFINLETGEIIHAVEGKSVESVTPFILELKEKAKQLKTIAIDMNAAYASVARNHLPKVDVVFDRFHVSALLNATIEEIRRDQQAKCNRVGLKVIKDKPMDFVIWSILNYVFIIYIKLGTHLSDEPFI